MSMRGIQKPGHRVVTSAVRWQIDETAAGYSRRELLALLTQ